MSRDKHNEENEWNNDVYKTITFESDEVADEKTYEAFTYLARREELRELLISVYPPLGYNVAGGGEAATHLANVILADGYRKASDVTLEVIKKVEQILTVKIIGIEEDFFHGTAAHWDGTRKACYEEMLVELAELKKKYTQEK